MRGNSRSLDTKRALLRSMRGSFLPPRLGLYATPDPGKEPQRASYDLMQALGTSAQIVPNGSEVACESNALIGVSPASRLFPIVLNQVMWSSNPFEGIELIRFNPRSAPKTQLESGVEPMLCPLFDA